MSKALSAALLAGDIDAIEPLLAEHVIWGECRDKASVVAHLTELLDAGLRATASNFVQREDRIITNLTIANGAESFECSFAAFDEAGLLVELHGPMGHNDAASVKRAGPFPEVSEQTAFSRVVPVLPVADIAAAAAHYQTLGFEVTLYEGGAAYGYALRGDVELHLSQHGGLDPQTTTSAAYLYVADAKALYAEWRSAGASGKLHPPTDTDYGLCEGAYIDPDGNLLRFGSPIS